MLLQLFRFAKVSVRGPMGVFEETRMFPAKAGSISHGGITYLPREDGWIEVPYDVALELLTKRHHDPSDRRGSAFSRFCTPEEVDEQVRLGMAENVQMPQEATPKRTPAKAKASAS